MPSSRGAKLIKRVCPQCGEEKEFDRRQTFCSAKCYNENRAERAKQAVRLRSEALRKRHQVAVNNAVIDKELDKPYQDEQEYLIRENNRLHRALEKARLDVNNARRVQRDVARRSLAIEDELVTELARIATERQTISLSPGILEAHRTDAESLLTPDHSEDAVLLTGDQHWGARFRKNDVCGFNEYDAEIGANRWYEAISCGSKVLRLHRAMYPINDLWMALLGDTGNGELWDAPQTNQLFVPAQIDFAFNMLDFAFQDLLALRPNVIGGSINVVPTVGNHMRTTERMPLIYQAQRTYDWTIYRMLYAKYKSAPGVQFVDSDEPFIFQSIRGHKYCFTHGAQVAYINNPDKQVREINHFITLVRALFDSPVYRAAAAKRLEDAAPGTFDRMVIGNIHFPLSMSRACVNGSLTGQNELGVNWTLEPIHAGQWLFGVSNRHAKTWEYFLDVTQVQREGSNPYKDFAVEYAKRFGR